VPNREPVLEVSIAPRSELSSVALLPIVPVRLKRNAKWRQPASAIS
jgi:hypothetical protein